MSHPFVVHCKKQPYDVYIGRGGRWGNPFKIGQHGTRAEVIEKYRVQLWVQIQQGTVSIDDLAALYGKTLGCWCAPQPCHGDVLAQAAEWANLEVLKRDSA